MKGGEMSLTEEEYLNKLGLSCPNCETTDIKTDDLEIEMGYAWQNCKCRNCGATWDDHYNLVGYDNLITVDTGFYIENRIQS